VSVADSPVWADPPPQMGEPVWSELADKLRAEPGRWALLGAQLARSTAHHIQTGRYAAFRPAGSFQTMVRNTQGNRADVYVRFRGKRRRG
jgi:hypothetical protein